MRYETVKPKKIDKYIAFSQVLSHLRLLVWNQKGKGEVRSSEQEVKSNAQSKSQGKTTFKQNLELIKAFCEFYNIESFFCFQPTLIFNEESLTKVKTEINRATFYKGQIEEYKEIYRIIKDISPKEKWINLTALSYKEECFLDYIHPSPIGTDFIASIVIDSLKSNYFEKQTE